jgi:hypothetical protein
VSYVSDLATALQCRVNVLAGDIGERNVFRPAALHATADYIERQWAIRGCVAASADLSFIARTRWIYDQHRKSRFARSDKNVCLPPKFKRALIFPRVV